MITFETYNIFNEALKNDKVLTSLIEAGVFGDPPTSDIDSQLNQQFASRFANQQNAAIRQQAMKLQTLSDLVRNRKPELIQALQQLSHVPIVKSLMTAINNEI